MENLTEISKAVEECETKMDIPGSLPIEIFHEVLLYLSSQDLYNAWKCCRQWRYRMESFWQKKCRIEHYFECEEDLRSTFYRNFMARFSHWEGIYIYNSKLRDNWVNLHYKEIVVQHDVTYSPFLCIERVIYYISDDVIIISTTGTDPKELLVFNCSTGAVEKRFCPPFDQSLGVANIDAIEIIENHLIVMWEQHSYPENRNWNLTVILYLTVWNVESGELLMQSETEIFKAVLKVIIYKNLVTVLTRPYKAIIFNIKTGNLDYEQCYISSACHYNDKIILGNHTGTILMMDLKYTKLMTLECCTNERTIINIVMERNYLICICESQAERDCNRRRACIWNIETKTKLYELQNVAKDDIKLFVEENKLCYSSKYSFKLCHLDTGECLVELLQEQYDVFTNNFLIIQREKKRDGLLQMRSIRTGELVANLDIIFPFTPQFFHSGCIDTKKTKTKIVHFKYDLWSSKPSEGTLIIIDFQAQLEV